MTTPLPPTCVGTHEPEHPECDGDPPCAWRDKCGAFKQHLEQTQSRLDVWVDGEGRLLRDPWRFNEDCLLWVDQYNIVDGLAPAPETPEVVTGSLFSRFKIMLLAKLEREITPRGRVALPGQLYMVDYLKHHGYVTIYCRASRGWDMPVVRIDPKARSKALEIRLPFAPNQLTGVDVRVLNHGQFKTGVTIDDQNIDSMVQKIGEITRLPDAWG